MPPKFDPTEIKHGKMLINLCLDVAYRYPLNYF